MTEFGEKRVTTIALLNDREDDVDGLPEKPYFNCLDFFGNVGSILAFLFDMTTDAALIYFYYNRGDVIYGSLTVTFVLFPALVINLLSCKWYWTDSQNVNIPGKVSKVMWFFRIISHLILMATVWRCIENIYFGLKSTREANSKRRLTYYRYMVFGDADVSLLKLLEAFMESAPQLVLQLFILVKNAQVIRIHFETGFIHTGVPYRQLQHQTKFLADNDPFLGDNPKITILVQLTSIAIALLSLSWALTSHERNSRFSESKKRNLSNIGTAFYFFWHLFTVGARVLAISLFASVFTYWIALVLLIRWIVMSTWIISLQRRLCNNQYQQHSFELIFGFVYLFAYLNLKDEPTRRKYLFFYSYEVIEDSILVALWAWCVNPVFVYFYWIALISHFGGVCLGLTCMVIYYIQFHPNGPVRNVWGKACTALEPPVIFGQIEAGTAMAFQRLQWPKTYV